MRSFILVHWSLGFFATPTRKTDKTHLNYEKTDQSDNLARNLDLTSTIEKDEKLSTKLYDKHDDFDFHIV